jgi:hypothetical protein
VSAVLERVGGPLLFVVFIAIIVAGIIYAHRQAEKRRAAIAAWAATHGLTFSRERYRSLDDAYPFACLRQGNNRYAYNLSRGRVGDYDVCAFDYHYETYSSDSKGRRTTHHHHFSAVVLETPLPLRPLSIRPENVFDRIGEFVGLDDIDFELAEFSREFHVKSPDRRWAFDVLHQEAMEFLLSAPRFHLEFDDGHVIVRRTRKFAPEEFEAAFALGTGLVDRLPGSVVRELRGQH